MSLIQEYIGQFDKTIDHTKHEIASLRTGRATPAIVEDVRVEAYGTMQPLKAVASINVADAKTLTIEPWDKNVLHAVEEAIRNSGLGMNPVNDGKLIRLPLPDLTQERREELIKVLHKKLEEARITIRKIREDVRNMIDAREKKKEIGEDEKYALEDGLEKVVKEYNEKIKILGEEKEKDIRTI